MNKIIFSLLIVSNFLFAGLVNGIAILVNNTPITLYDIDQKMLQTKLSKNQAVDILIDEVLYKQELKKYNISVDLFDIENHIEKLAAQNKMDILQFKSLVRQQQNYEVFKEQIKKQLLHQKLITKIAGGKLKIATDADMKIFYDNNQEQFKLANKFEVIAYVSKNKKLLEEVKTNPLLTNPQIAVQNISFTQDELNPQVKYILNSTDDKKFSVIFAQNKHYNMFFIKEKSGIKTISFEDAKNSIFQQIMKKREQNYLKEYFETLKITADIQILR